MYFTFTQTLLNGDTAQMFILKTENAEWHFTENHRFYQDYLAWVAEGNTPEPWEPETVGEPES